MKKKNVQRALALALAANAVVPFENRVVKIVNIARKPAIIRFHFCFIKLLPPCF